MSTTALDHVNTGYLPPPAEPNFALDEDGFPVYLGTTEQEYADDWDSVSTALTKDLWSLSAIAASIVTSYGEGNVSQFAYDHHTSASWVRKLAKTYRAFESGTRIAKLSFYVHLEAATAKNPVRAIKIANDREMSTRELKRWIYMGEGRADKSLPPAPSASDKPAEITVEAEDPDDEENISIEDEPMSEEDRSLARADIELGLRMVAAFTARAQGKYILRYFVSLEQELDWELEAVTKIPGTLADRVESLIRGGCWTLPEIMKRAKIATAAELNRICSGLEKAGKIKWSRERKRKHGTAPEMWMPSDMPDGDEFNMPRSRYETDEDMDEHF